jgi:6-phosphogluconolactonase (cycloisomerase 2 family)
MLGRVSLLACAMLSAKEFPMKKAITQAMMCLATAAFLATAVMMVPGATMAQSSVACAYANDDISHFVGPNTVDGYLVTATSETYLNPVGTGGQSSGGSLIPNMVVSPVKKILYAADSQSGDVAAMNINPTTCQLTVLGNYPVGGAEKLGIGLAISPNGRWLYAAEVNSAELMPFAIRKDGSLSAVHQKITLLDRPSSMAISPDSSTLIVAVPARPKHGNYLIPYSINQLNGMLTLVSTTPAKGRPYSINIDSQGKFVYVSEPDNEHPRVGVWELGPGSELTFIHNYGFPEVAGSFTISSSVLSSNGRYLYVTNPNQASITTLSVNSVTGVPKYVTTTTDGIVGENYPIGVATTKNGSYLFTGVFTSDGPQEMGIFAANKKDGSLTSLGMFPVAAGNPAWVAARAF